MFALISAIGVRKVNLSFVSCSNSTTCSCTGLHRLNFTRPRFVTAAVVAAAAAAAAAAVVVVVAVAYSATTVSLHGH